MRLYFYSAVNWGTNYSVYNDRSVSHCLSNSAVKLWFVKLLLCLQILRKWTAWLAQCDNICDGWMRIFCMRACIFGLPAFKAEGHPVKYFDSRWKKKSDNYVSAWQHCTMAIQKQIRKQNSVGLLNNIGKTHIGLQPAINPDQCVTAEPMQNWM